MSGHELSNRGTSSGTFSSVEPVVKPCRYIVISSEWARTVGVKSGLVPTPRHREPWNSPPQTT